MVKKIPVSTTFHPMATGLGGIDFSSLGALPPGEKDSLPAHSASGPQGDVPLPARAGRVVLRREKSGRSGKVVVIVDGFGPDWSDPHIAALAKSARQACGCGGTVVGRQIELQGDQVPRVREFLASHGLQVGGVT